MLSFSAQSNVFAVSCDIPVEIVDLEIGGHTSPVLAKLVLVAVDMASNNVD